jgi:hypothetical protein
MVSQSAQFQEMPVEISAKMQLSNKETRHISKQAAE